jgi:molybdopterin converting factor small subunit
VEDLQRQLVSERLLRDDAEAQLAALHDLLEQKDAAWEAEVEARIARLQRKLSEQEDKLRAKDVIIAGQAADIDRLQNAETSPTGVTEANNILRAVAKAALELTASHDEVTERIKERVVRIRHLSQTIMEALDRMAAAAEVRLSKGRKRNADAATNAHLQHQPNIPRDTVVDGQDQREQAEKATPVQAQGSTAHSGVEHPTTLDNANAGKNSMRALSGQTANAGET